MSGSVGLPRTYLYVPGNAPARLEKALGLGCDAVLIDLEDAVPLPEKDSTLARVVDWLDGQPGAGPELWVRLNAGERRAHEVAALVGHPAVTGLTLAKADDPADVRAVVDMLERAGDTATELMPMIESAVAVQRVAELAACPRVRQLQIGEVDLTGELGIEPGPDEVELLGIRTQVLIASIASGIGAPVGPVSRITRDVEAFRESTRRLRRLGFHGRCCIHPMQVQVVHEVLTPTPEEIASARDVMRLLEAAEAAGSGVVLDGEGRLIDAAVLKQARTVLALAERPHA